MRKLRRCLMRNISIVPICQRFFGLFYLDIFPVSLLFVLLSFIDLFILVRPSLIPSYPLLTFLLYFLLFFSPQFLPSFLTFFVLSFLLSFHPTFLPIFLPFRLPSCLPACLPSFIPPALPSCHAFLPFYHSHQ